MSEASLLEHKLPPCVSCINVPQRTVVACREGRAIVARSKVDARNMHKYALVKPTSDDRQITRQHPPQRVCSTAGHYY